MQEKNDVTIEDIIKLQKQNYSKSDSKLIRKAYDFAFKYHGENLWEKFFWKGKSV